MNYSLVMRLKSPELTPDTGEPDHLQDLFQNTVKIAVTQHVPTAKLRYQDSKGKPKPKVQRTSAKWTESQPPDCRP